MVQTLVKLPEQTHPDNRPTPSCTYSDKRWNRGDEIGAWARSSAASIKGRLARICPRGDEAHIVAFLTRGLKYQAMADIAGCCYQPHIARRDFTVSFQLGTSSADRQQAASAAESALGVPKVSPVLIRPLMAAAQHGFRGNSYQQFLYKEFVAAWRRS